jgi:long-chain acyl-CoA synthetase
MGREKLRKMRKGPGSLPTDRLYTLQSLVEGLPELGDRPAVLALHKEGAERWSYRELADHALRLAHGLAGAGVERGDRVALFAPNRPEWVAACLAVIRAGAVAVPLDAQLGEVALEGILESSEAKLIFTTSERADLLYRLDTDASPVLLDAADDDERGWRRLLADAGTELPGVEPEDVAALFYTSGTTGAAKGVPLSHRNIVYQLETLLGADLVDEHDRLMLPLPLHHVYPFVVGMLTPLAAGLPIVFPSSLTGPQLVRALNKGKVTLIVGVPRLYSALYSGIEDRARSGGRVAAGLFDVALNLCANVRDRTGLDVGRVLMRPVRNRLGPKLKTLASGGAPLDPALARKLEALGWRVGVGYGLTETSPLLSLKKPDGKKLASVGRPVSGTEIRIDPSAMPDEEGRERRTDTPHEEGEILARGPGAFSGYLPDKTAEVLTEDGWFRTGDLGYFDDEGYLYVTGRASTLIVTEGGKNVQPEDVEAAYSESPVIGEIGVLQKDDRLVAVIVPEPGEIKHLSDDDAEGAIREAVEQGAKRLPSYQRLSDYAVTREPLEYTQLGKLRRHLLEERYDRAKAGDAGEAPGPIPVEEMSGEDRALLEDDAAREVWELLARRYPDRRLTPNTSPQLDLGLDSMEWVNLTMEIGEHAGIELDEEAIARVDTVRDLLREATEAGEAVPGASPVERPEETLDETQKRRLEPLSPAESAASRGMFAFNRALMRGPFRLRVRGLENLPESGPFVLTPNHVSYLDSFALAAALDDGRLRETYWAGWVGATFGNPVTRLVSRLARVVPIDPAHAGTSSLAFGAAVLGRGKNLVWFPEGERSWTGELGPFKRGLGVLLEYHRVPVVPVFVEGTYAAMPRGSALVRPRRITVTFGQPLGVDELERRGDGEEPRDRIVEALRDRISEMGEGRA